MSSIQNIHTINSFTSSWCTRKNQKLLTLESGAQLRYIDIGYGKPILLLHTIRTQLDYFYKLIPELTDHYRIIAVDLPAHGYSTLKLQNYDEKEIRGMVIELIDSLGLANLSIAGESIGAILALTIANERPNVVKHVFAMNPYDYGEKFGGGVRRSNNGWIVSFYSIFRSATPVPKSFLRKVMEGGFASPEKLDGVFLNELHKTGKLNGHRKAEYRAFKSWRSWRDAKELYGGLKVPVTIIYGESDWSNEMDRLRTQNLIPRAKVFQLKHTGHFSCLENPKEVAEIILNGNEK